MNDEQLDYVPFNRAYTTGAEIEYIREAIATTRLSGNGPFSHRCCGWLEESVGARRALMTHSCTGALELAMLLVGVEPGDEVIMPSFTFVSTANAVVLRGGVPVFVDIRRDTLNLDERLLEEAVTEATKAIIPVHYAGVGCEMDAILELATRYGLAVVEDAAQGVQASLGGRPLGSFGAAAAFSFHETKNVMCGEGGALVVNREDWVERAEILQEKGTDRSQFFRGQVDKYTWRDIGSSFPMSDINAAFLWAQLKEAADITSLRLSVWRRYHEAFVELEEDGLVRRPFVPESARHNAHIYYLLLPTAARRDAALAALRVSGVDAVFHYIPLHTAEAGRLYGRAAGPLEVTEAVASQLLRLPLWAGMTDREIEFVIAGVRSAVRVATGAR
jgi:dTDP-4-amino-4,6-dideoxygalactose transaminase